MPSQTLNQNRLKNLREIAYDINKVYAAELPGEPFHPTYLKDKENFRKLLESAMKLETGLKGYFSHLASRIQQGVDWTVYHQKIQGSVYTSDIFWEGEIIQLQTEFTDNTDIAFDIGASDGQQDMGLTISYDSKDPAAIEAIRTYTGQLAKDLTDTTHEATRQSILRSIALGETQEQAVKRLQQIINDPKRAAKIAHTETVRAYTEGKIAVGKEVGATQKMWRDGQSGACPICRSLNQQTVAFDDAFPGGFNGPPAHPWCKCNMKVIVDANALGVQANDFIQGKTSSGWITLKNGRHIFIGDQKSNNGRLHGVNYKHTNDLVAHESVDLLRVHQYQRLIANGHEVAPLVVTRHDSHWDVEDGKHRLEAYKQLGIKLVPTILKESMVSSTQREMYDRLTQNDHNKIQQLPRPNRITL